MFLHGPDAGVVLIQQITLGCFCLLPHIGNTEHQIFKGDRAVLAGGQGAFGTVRAGKGEHGASEWHIVCTIYLQDGQLARPNIIVDGQVVPGIVLLDGLPILGDGDLIDRLITVISRPAGALLDAVNTIGQALGGAFAILADGDNVPFGLFCGIITASGLEIHSKRGAFLRLLVPGNGIQCVLGQLDFAVNYGVADCQGKAVLGVRIVVIAGFQLVHGFI